MTGSRYSLYLEEFKNGKLTNFNFFYEETKKAVFYNILSLTKNYDVAEDILQETYLKFLKNIQDIKSSSSLLGYLITTSKNLCLDYFKKKKDEQIEESYDVKSSDIYDLDKVLLLERIRKILKDKEYQLILLHIIEGYTFEEISSLTNEKLGTLLSRYNSALKKLRKEIKYEEFR